jgi:hypothetical protein
MSFMLSGAMLARSWNVAYLCIGERLTVGDFIYLHPGDAQPLVRFIFLERYIVLGKAGHHAGAASGTLVQINDHAIAFGLVFCLRLFHLNLISTV